MQELLQLIEDERIAAPAPIEQRWSAASSSPMSPASSDFPDDLFTWVGIIMYIPTEDPEERKIISSRCPCSLQFADCCGLMLSQACCSRSLLLRACCLARQHQLPDTGGLLVLPRLKVLQADLCCA